MNQLIDMGDIEGFQKVSKVYNDLMKSGKFKLWAMKNFTQLSLGVNNLILLANGEP